MRIFITLFLLLTTSNAFSYVGGINSGGAFPSSIKVHSAISFCSAVKVADHFILTAAHCILRNNFNKGEEIRVVAESGRITDPNNVVTKIKDYIPHPTWQIPMLDDDHFVDLAIIVTEDSLSKITSAPIDLRPVKIGEHVIVGGFGEKGPGYPEYPHMTVAMKSVSGFTNKLYFEIGLNDVRGTKSMGAVGDSGGAVYRVNSDEQYSVVGINHSTNVVTEQFVLDEETGMVKEFLPHPLTPEAEHVLRLTKLGFTNDDDPLQIVNWLKTNLPKSAFALY